MSPGKVRTLLGAALLATVVAAWFAPAGDGAVVDPAARATPVRTAALRETGRGVAGAPLQVLEIHRRDLDAEDVDDADEAHVGQLFAATQWSTPASVAPAVPLAAAPAPVAAQAPPLPFHVLGRYEEAGQSIVFLQYNEQNLVVRAGDTIADVYKVERLSGSTMTLRYLPLNLAQSLDVGAELKEK